MRFLVWGSHIGQLFDSATDLREMLVPYFQAGLLNNERCLWVTDGTSPTIQTFLVASDEVRLRWPCSNGMEATRGGPDCGLPQTLRISRAAGQASTAPRTRICKAVLAMGSRCRFLLLHNGQPNSHGHVG